MAERYEDPIRLIETSPQVLIPQLIQAMERGAGEPLYPGDERRIQAESLGLALVAESNLIDDAGRQVMLRYARGEVLDALGERLDVHRLEPEPAKTTLRFTVSSPQAKNIIIPQGTKATTDGDVYFATSRQATLKSGDRYVDVPARCTEAGSQYNGYEPGMISTLVALIPYISAVHNLETTYDGDDGEPYTEEGDDRLRERIMLAPAALSTAGPIDAYRSYALKADADIIDAAVISVVEHQTKTLRVYDRKAFIGGDKIKPETIKILRPDGTEAKKGQDFSYVYEDSLLTISLFGELAHVSEVVVNIEIGREGEVRILPLMKGGKLPTQDILDKVQAICGADDVRPMTDIVHAECPEVVPFDIELTYWTQTAVESDVVETIEGSGGAIEQFVEWQTSTIGESINPDMLRRLILVPDWDTGLTGALRVQINSPTWQDLEDYQVAQWSGVIKVSHHISAR